MKVLVPQWALPSEKVSFFFALVTLWCRSGIGRFFVVVGWFRLLFAAFSGITLSLIHGRSSLLGIIVGPAGVAVTRVDPT